MATNTSKSNPFISCFPCIWVLEIYHLISFTKSIAVALKTKASAIALSFPKFIRSPVDFRRYCDTARSLCARVSHVSFVHTLQMNVIKSEIYRLKRRTNFFVLLVKSITFHCDYTNWSRIEIFKYSYVYCTRHTLNESEPLAAGWSRHRHTGLRRTFLAPSITL